MELNAIDTGAVLLENGRLPEHPSFEPGIRRAPRREARLSAQDKALAVKNALRYIPPQFHAQMAEEFARELQEHGRIYGYRFRPRGRIWGRPIDEYQGNCIEGRAIQVMIDNNLDFDVALYPYELVTYGETGQVCQNWMQYRLIMAYLQQLTQQQTLAVLSGHPLGLFRSHEAAPRVILTNGLMVGAFDDQQNFNRAAALGVANYGQMTAGGWMYIGPQGIVHGTFNTLLNAGRLKLGIPREGDLAGRLFVSAGLGGMSGAQGKAAEIAGAVALIAEVDDSRIETRFSQGWVSARTASLPEALALAIMNNDEKALAVAPGVGKKIAQRVILELKDKIRKEMGGADYSLPAASGASPAVQDGSIGDAMTALSVLGYSAAEVTPVIKKLDVGGMSAEQIIKAVLKHMVK